MAGSELRAPLFVQQGRYDALDFRNMIGQTRGAHVGVSGASALLVERVDNPTPRVSVAPGSVWLPDTVSAAHAGAVHFAHLDAEIQLKCTTPTPGEGNRQDLVVAFAEADTVPARGVVDMLSTAPRHMQAVYFEADGTPYSSGSREPVDQAGAKGWSVAVLAETTPGAKDWEVPDNSVRLALVDIAETGITGVQDLRFVTPKQVDTTPLQLRRTAGAQGVAEAAAGAPEGSIIYDTHSKHLSVVTGPGTYAPVSVAPRVVQPYRKAGDGAWGQDAFLEFNIGTEPYERLVSVSGKWSCVAAHNNPNTDTWWTPVVVSAAGAVADGERRQWVGPADRPDSHKPVFNLSTELRVPAGADGYFWVGVRMGWNGEGGDTAPKNIRLTDSAGMWGRAVVMMAGGV